MGTGRCSRAAAQRQGIVCGDRLNLVRKAAVELVLRQGFGREPAGITGRLPKRRNAQRRLKARTSRPGAGGSIRAAWANRLCTPRAASSRKDVAHRTD